MKPGRSVKERLKKLKREGFDDVDSTQIQLRSAAGIFAQSFEAEEAGEKLRLFKRGLVLLQEYMEYVQHDPAGDTVFQLLDFSKKKLLSQSPLLLAEDPDWPLWLEYYLIFSTCEFETGEEPLKKLFANFEMRYKDHPEVKKRLAEVAHHWGRDG